IYMLNLVECSGKGEFVSQDETKWDESRCTMAEPRGLRCKCAGNNASREKTCKEKCEEAFKYPCGDTADTNVFSIYTIENVPPSEHSQDNNRNCLLFFYNYSPGYNYYWDSCSATLNSNPALLCSNKYISEDNPMAKIHNRSDVIWAQAVENCIVARKFPASIQSIKNGNFTNQHEQDYWTGIIRKEYIISLNDMLDKSTNPPLTYAYVELINQTFYVRYADEEGDQGGDRTLWRARYDRC
ncbi:hypothetical protein MAR_014494, partial [Mya arenaria]